MATETRQTAFDLYAGMLAHELGTPASVLAGYLDLLDDEKVRADPALLSEFLATARRHAHRLAETLGALAGTPDRFSRSSGIVDARMPVIGQDDAALRAELFTRQEREQREHVAQANAQALRAIQDFRAAQRQAALLARQRDEAYLETVMALARAVEARDSITGEHIERVRHISILLGDILGISGEARRHLEFAAVLHDVGKICLPDALLGKPGPLTDQEREVMRRHAFLGGQVLAGIAFLEPVAAAVAAHHERWDGLGYPAGLAGAAIPIEARVIAVADAYDAITSIRPYKAARSPEQARVEIARGIGSHFDPEIGRAFLDTDQVRLDLPNADVRAARAR